MMKLKQMLCFSQLSFRHIPITSYILPNARTYSSSQAGGTLLYRSKWPSVRPAPAAMLAGFGAFDSPIHVMHMSTDSGTKDPNLNPTSFDGTDLTIVEYPHPVLRTKASDIERFDEELKELCKEMITIMYQADGVGLAAPQVNISKRLFVYNYLGDPKKSNLERIVCNPTILEYSKETDVEEEGCLSSRSGCCAGIVRRSKSIFVEYTGVTGQKTRRRLKGFEARVFQHEYDHVQGILHLDRFSEECRLKIQPELDKMVCVYKKSDGILEIAKSVRESLQPPTLLIKEEKLSMLDSLTGNSPASDEEEKISIGATTKKASGFGGGGKSVGSVKKKAKNKKRKK